MVYNDLRLSEVSLLTKLTKKKSLVKLRAEVILDGIKAFTSSDQGGSEFCVSGSESSVALTVALPSDYETCVRTLTSAATFQEDEKQPGAKFIFGVTFLHL